MNEESIRDIYNRIIHIVTYFLDDRTFLTIDALKQRDPTVEELSLDLKVLTGVLRELAEDEFEDEQLALNASQCCVYMGLLAKAVRSDNAKEVEYCFNKLELLIQVP